MTGSCGEFGTTAGGTAFPHPGRPSLVECWAGARAVRRAPLGKETLDMVRPRGVSGLFRSGAPLTVQLRLAAHQGRLLWWSPQTFALLEPPGNSSAQGGSRLLRWMDRWWGLLH